MENIDIDNKKVLSAIHSSGSFFCCEWQQDRLLRTFEADTKNLIPQNAKVHIGSVSQNTALIPMSEYRSDSNFAYLHLMSRITSPEQWTVQTMEIDSTMMMVAGENLGNHHDALIKYSWIHSDGALLHTCLASGLDSSHPMVYMDVYHNLLSIWVVTDKGLTFHNNYYISSAEDLIYYIALVYNQNELDLNADPLKLSGHIVEGSSYFSMIHDYVRHYSFWNLGFQHNNIQAGHIYNRSFAIASCV